MVSQYNYYFFLKFSVSESPFCANFDISFSLFCRKSVQSWMRRFWAKNVEETTYGAYDGPSFLRWSVGGSVEKLLKEDGEVWPSVGLRSLWRSVVAMTVRPAGTSWSSEKWSQYPDSKSWSVLEWRPSTDRCAYDGPSHLPSRGMKKAAEEIAPSMGRRSPRRSIVTTTVRRPSRFLVDFQLLQSLFN